MLKVRVNLRKVAAIAACLAETTVFASCEKEDDDPIDTGTEQDANIVAFTFEGIVGKADIKKEDFTVTAKADETVNGGFERNCGGLYPLHRCNRQSRQRGAGE